MLDITEAQQLMEKLIDLRVRSQESKTHEDSKNYQKHLSICSEQFRYLITMHADRYRSFSNYEDLVQEGHEALLKAMKNYNPDLGNVFWWIHKYVSTRISRSANLHTTIRYPLKVARAMPPHKETSMPIMIEEKHCPDQEVEAMQVRLAINTAAIKLTTEQQDIITMTYGLGCDKPMSINKICKQINITRPHCIKMMRIAMAILKDNIKI